MPTRRDLTGKPGGGRALRRCLVVFPGEPPEGQACCSQAAKGRVVFAPMTLASPARVAKRQPQVSMPERVIKWQPVADIDSAFGAVSYSFDSDALVVRMSGVRPIVLRFFGLVALRFEQECPGFDFPAHPLPMLRASETFPLLRIEQSQWLERYLGMYGELAHFALVSSDHLLELLAKPNAEARWEVS
jgi:hypothetical protein